MDAPRFAHLNVHSCFSLMRGVPEPGELCEAAKAAGMRTLALTDTDGLYGLIWFLQEARARGVAPVVGAEVTDPRTPDRAVVLVRDRPRGYPALCEMISRRHTGEGFSLAGALAALDGSLIVLTDSRDLIGALAGVDGLYCEIRTPVGSHALSRWAADRGVPCVATADVHLVHPDQHGLHRLLRAVATNRALEDVPDRELAPQTAWLKPEALMRSELPHLPEAFEHAARIADACAKDWSLGNAVFPRFASPGGGNAFALLRHKCERGIRRRYDRPGPEVKRRLERELSVIGKKGFADIFLIVADVVESFGLTCGRGSAAASLVSYLLGITHVDPVAHDLFFERFLNEKREDPPDIDVDFAWDERDRALEYIFAKYGDGRVAMVSNHVGFRAGAALRETAKVYGLPEEEIARVTGRLRGLWYHVRGSIAEILRTHPAFQDLDLSDPWPEIIEAASLLEGRPRHLSVHCGGVVMVPDRIDRRIPVQITPKGLPVIQLEKDQAEDAGLVKIDILGNRSLAVIRDALAAIRKHHGISIAYEKLNPLDDPDTRALLARGETVGVFYVESPAMRQLQQKTGRGDFEHLVVHSSIIRPAANEYIREYVRRLRGGAWEPLHPVLGEILAETHGIMCYQEDVSKTAMAMAGFDAAEADGLRKILSKKTKRRLPEYREKFFRGAAERGVDPGTVGKVWDMILSFAGYSFCKPHSASYALVSFKSAWLRAHYPAEFMAAVISNGGGYYCTFAYVSECRRMGLRVLSPDVNASRRPYAGSGDHVRIGLMQIKGLSESAIDAVLEGRRDRPYRDLEDFLARVDIDPSDARLLIKAGCFDSIARGTTRPDMMWRVHRRAAQRERGNSPCLPLFGDDPEEGVPRTEEYDAAAQLRHEVEVLGFLASRHPLELYRDRLSRLGRVRARDLHRHVGRMVTVAGWYVTGKVVSSKNGDPMEFVSFEDTTALFETVFFPKAYANFCHRITHARPYLLRGRVQEDFGAVTLNVSEVRLL